LPTALLAGLAWRCWPGWPGELSQSDAAGFLWGPSVPGPGAPPWRPGPAGARGPDGPRAL